MSEFDAKKRDFLKKTAYIAPVILTLPAIPSLASAGSARRRRRRFGNNGVGNGIDPQPPGNPPINDGLGTRPGKPGLRR